MILIDDTGMTRDHLSPESPSWTLTVNDRWLHVDLLRQHRTASWAIVGGGLTEAQHVLWHEIHDRELGSDVDPRQLLQNRLLEYGFPTGIGMLTSRNLAHYETSCKKRNQVEANCLATVGLGNALRVGAPRNGQQKIGTINVLCTISVPLTTEALLEMLSIAAEARTAAVLDVAWRSNDGDDFCTGTGTDCIVAATPMSQNVLHRYAGKHTAIGESVGACVYEAVHRGARTWCEQRKQS